MLLFSTNIGTQVEVWESLAVEACNSAFWLARRMAGCASGSRHVQIVSLIVTVYLQ